RWGIGIVHAGSGVDHPLLQVQGWGRPDGDARRTPRFGPGLILSGDLRRIGNGVGLPDLSPCCSVEGDDASPKRTAFVSGVGCSDRLVSSRDGNIQPSR